MCSIVALFKRKNAYLKNEKNNLKLCAKFQANSSKSIRTGTSKRRSKMRILKAKKIGPKDLRRPADLCWHKQLICKQECHIRRI